MMGMTWPDVVTLRELRFAPSHSLETGDGLVLRATTIASRSLLRMDGAVRLDEGVISVDTTAAGAPLTITLPVTDQAGWADADSREQIVLGADEHTHTYTTRLAILHGTRVLSTSEFGPFVLPAGPPLEADVELLPTGQQGISLPAPEIWGRLVAEAELAMTRAESASQSAQRARDDAAAHEASAGSWASAASEDASVANVAARASEQARDAAAAAAAEAATAAENVERFATDPDAVMTETLEGDTTFRQALSSSIAGGVAGVLAPVKEKLAARQPVTLAIATDSTGFESAGWFYRMAKELQALYPEYTLRSRWWNDATSTLDSNVQATGRRRLGLASDSFLRAAGDLVGTAQPRGGAAWAGATGAWSLTGAGSVQYQGAGGYVTSNGIGAAAGSRWQMQGQVTVASSGTTQRVISMGSYRAGSSATGLERLCLEIQVTDVGVTMARIAGTFPASATVANFVTLPGLTPGETHTLHWTLDVNGTTVTAVVNGTTITGTLTTDQATIAAGLTGLYLHALTGALTGWSVANLSLDSMPVLTGAPEMVVIIGGKPGTTLDYQQARLATMFPGSIDHLHINNGHNYEYGTPSAFLAAYDAFVGAYRAAHPESAMTAVMQNPQFPTKATAAAHRARLAALPSYARENGLGILDALSVFERYPNWTRVLMRIDQVHPTAASTYDEASDPANGQYQWMQAALAQFL